MTLVSKVSVYILKSCLKTSNANSSGNFDENVHVWRMIAYDV